MKKILQVTLFDNNNIGNRLQNYALHRLLEKKGFYVVNLDDRGISKMTAGQKVKNRIKFILGILGLQEYKFKYLKEKNRSLRIDSLHKFSEEFVFPIVRVKYNDLSSIDPTEYEFAVVGSDQVWHNWGNDHELEYFYLSFMPTEKRYSYASSFGFEVVPEEDKLRHYNGLKGMKYISCREQKGCEIVSDLIGRKVPHVLDPTLLLDKEEWNILLEKANDFAKNKKNFVFVLFLGQITEEYKNVINKFSKGKEIINFMDYTNEEIAKCGPKEFIYLISHADFVFTDSFHCTVFSIIYKKQFLVFRRKQKGFENMFGRIEELLLSTNNGDKAYGGLSTYNVESFESLKEKSLNYLNEICDRHDSLCN